MAAVPMFHYGGYSRQVASPAMFSVFNPTVGSYSHTNEYSRMSQYPQTFQQPFYMGKIMDNNFKFPSLIKGNQQNVKYDARSIRKDNNNNSPIMKVEKYFHADANGMLSQRNNSSASSRSSESECHQANSNLIVNYVPPEMTDVEFGRMFMAFGKVDSVKLVRNMKTNVSLGYGFIKFQEQHDAERAVEAMNGLKIGNKEIKVSFARPSRAEIKNANLYVSNLPSNVTTTAALEDLFSGYGSIVTSRLLRDKNFRPRGVGFVRFNLRGEAAAAVAGLNGLILESNCAPLLVKFAKNTTTESFARFPKFAAPPLMPKAPTHSVLYVSNVGADVDESALMALFRNFGHVVDLSIIRNSWHKRNYAFVTMLNEDSANHACQSLNGFVVGSQAIGVVFKG